MSVSSPSAHLTNPEGVNPEGVIPGAGHWVAEQAPEALLAALTTFLAPYRDKEGAAGNARRASSPPSSRDRRVRQTAADRDV
jgi:hypothetical protein